MKSINLSIMDFVKVIVGASMMAIGYQANTNVGDVANAMEAMKQEVKETKQEIMKLNTTMVRVVTTQERLIQTDNDHEVRIRDLERKQD